MNKKDLEYLFITKAGSHLYGTNIATSDVDYRGVVFQPISSLLGLNEFEQLEDKSEDDEVYYGLNKFCQLALSCNPNILELLFAPTTGETCVYVSPVWKKITNLSLHFLNTESVRNAFNGYAISQLKRMETHHKWMSGDPPVKPDWHDYGATKPEGSGLEWLNKASEQLYRDHLRRYNQYETWLKERNATRHELESKWGYDTKHAMHLIRLYEQGFELLTTGRIELPRPNSDWLLEIRNGKYTYEKLLEIAQSWKNNLDNVKSLLPTESDFVTVNETVMEINYRYIQGSLYANSL